MYSDMSKNRINQASFEAGAASAALSKRGIAIKPSDGGKAVSPESISQAFSTDEQKSVTPDLLSNVDRSIEIASLSKTSPLRDFINRLPKGKLLLIIGLLILVVLAAIALINQMDTSNRNSQIQDAQSSQAEQTASADAARMDQSAASGQQEALPQVVVSGEVVTNPANVQTSLIIKGQDEAAYQDFQAKKAAYTLMSTEISGDYSIATYRYGNDPETALYYVVVEPR